MPFPMPIIDKGVAAIHWLVDDDRVDKGSPCMTGQWLLDKNWMGARQSQYITNDKASGHSSIMHGGGLPLGMVGYGHDLGQ